MQNLKFNITDGAAAREYYESNGYVVFEGLIPSKHVDAVTNLYFSEVKSASDKFFRQSTSRYEPNVVNDHGHVRQSFLDIHAYESHPEFREAALTVYFSDEMKAALSVLTGEPTHNLMQSMLFDLNAATPPHQDWWYLDSVPSGGLLASWIALEDINERSGRFFVLPGSQNTVLHEPGLPHSKWIERMRAHVDQRPEALHSPAMNKGDVLYWNSRTIHGSHPTQDERFSRKSLTAHYLPSSLGYGNIFGAKEWTRFKDWRGNKYFANQPEYSLKADIVSRAKLAIYDNPELLKLARKFQKKPLSEIK